MCGKSPSQRSEYMRLRDSTLFYQFLFIFNILRFFTSITVVLFLLFYISLLALLSLYYYVLRKLMGKPWGFSAKMPYYAKMGACPMKNSGTTFTFMWNLESLCIHNLTYTRVGAWHLLNMSQYLSHVLSWSPATWMWTMNDVTVAFGLLSLHAV